MEDKKVYITFANAKRLTKSIFLNHLQFDSGKIFEYIFDSDTSSVLSLKDAKELLKLKMICEKIDFSEGFEIRDLEKYKSKIYIFQNKAPPKYHLDKNCEFLRSDYKNFLIPRDVRNRSAEEIKKFVDFCNSQSQRIIAKDPKFIDELNNTFDLKLSSIEELILKNSGVHEISKMSETELRIFIHLSLSRCIEIIKENIQDKKIFAHYQYKTLTRNDLENEELKPQVLEYIENKLYLIEGLHNLYYKENDETVEFEASLLMLAGFEKCKSCGKYM